MMDADSDIITLIQLASPVLNLSAKEAIDYLFDSQWMLEVELEDAEFVNRLHLGNSLPERKNSVTIHSTAAVGIRMMERDIEAITPPTFG